VDHSHHRAHSRARVVHPRPGARALRPVGLRPRRALSGFGTRLPGTADAPGRKRSGPVHRLAWRWRASFRNPAEPPHADVRRVGRPGGRLYNRLTEAQEGGHTRAGVHTPIVSAQAGTRPDPPPVRGRAPCSLGGGPSRRRPLRFGVGGRRLCHGG
jgi:hypothetical protein